MTIARLALALALLLPASPLAAQALPTSQALPAACRDAPVPERIEGRAFAVDGDTLSLPGRPRLRLWGIQAPELRDTTTRQETGPGSRARAVLADLLDAAPAVHCTPTKWDRYCRLVAVCRAAGLDLGEQMLAAGMAYTAWLDDPPGRTGIDPAAYAAAEAAARKDRRGLWKVWLRE